MPNLTERFCPDPARTLSAIEAVQPVFSLDMNGIVTDANDAYLALSGYDRDELVGMPIGTLAAPGAPTLPAEAWARLRAGTPQSVELAQRARSGDTFWISATHVPVAAQPDLPAHVVAFAVDVSDGRRQARDARLEIEALGNGQAVIEFKADGTVVSANDNFLNALGYRLDEIVGQHHRMFVPHAFLNSPAYRVMWDELGRGIPQNGQFERITKTGGSIWISGQYSPVLDDHGKVTRVIKIVSDITPQRVAMNALLEGLGRLATGDLTVRLGDEVAGDFVTVRENFNDTLATFSEMVQDIRARAEQMNGEAGSIANGAGDLARRGESQAAALEQTAAAVEEISGNITMTSQSAQDADAAARNAQRVVQEGAEVVARAIAAIERIDEHTKQMGEFTRVIEGFAFQTNLLSINAAVEAARAGEVGRGFAVVANEVRNLAQQSATASQNIADLIGKSETEVKSGVRLVRDAGTSLDQIRSVVSGMAENMTAIAQATVEQSAGVREVSTALSQLDETNQANLAMSESYAAAAGSLFSQVEELGTMMHRFRTEDAPAAMIAAAPARGNRAAA